MMALGWRPEGKSVVEIPQSTSRRTVEVENMLAR